MHDWISWVPLLMLYDVFISHASEDKDDFVRPLAERLRDEHIEVWYDEFTLRIGDSLRRSIDKGLAQSRFGIVVLSPSFGRNRWAGVGGAFRCPRARLNLQSADTDSPGRQLRWNGRGSPPGRL